jgi:hypothetical protein
VVKWCLDNEFELVELEPLDLDETGGGDEYEDDIRDVYGVERIAQALHAHVWPNLVRKGKIWSDSENSGIWGKYMVHSAS